MISTAIAIAHPWSEVTSDVWGLATDDRYKLQCSNAEG